MFNLKIRVWYWVCDGS